MIPGQVVVIDAKVRYGFCGTPYQADAQKSLVQRDLELEKAIQETADPAAREELIKNREQLHKTYYPQLLRSVSDALVGGTVRLQLVGPLFPGTIGPVSAVDQVVDSGEDSATYAWEVRPDKPGHHKLSLVLSLLAPDGEMVVHQNERVEVDIEVKETATYTTGRAWENTQKFLTSLGGLVVGIAAAVTAAVGVKRISQRRAPEEKPEAPKQWWLDRDDNKGYL